MPAFDEKWSDGRLTTFRIYSHKFQTINALYKA